MEHGTGGTHADSREGPVEGGGWVGSRLRVPNSGGDPFTAATSHVHRNHRQWVAAAASRRVAKRTR
eukprot:5042538-Prymnesium_polylepis.1